MSHPAGPAARDVAAGPWLSVDGRCTGLLAGCAATFASRAVGLLGSPPDAAPLALQIRPCAAVHTFGMRRAIDVAFVDAQGRVLRVFAALVPWRLAWSRGARAAWELPAGSAAALGIRCGTCLHSSATGPTVRPPTRPAAGIADADGGPHA